MLSSQHIYQALSLPELTVLERFNEGLDGLIPAMFHMTDQLVEAYPERQWNLFIGDDTSARLPVRFVRSVFRQLGHIISTRYIASSASVNKYKRPPVYEEYAQYITRGSIQPRALLITEATGHEFRSIRFTHKLFDPYCERLDTAIIGARSGAASGLGEVYFGAVGDLAVMDHIWSCLENPTDVEYDYAWSGATNNLDKNYDPDCATAKMTKTTEFRSLAAYCYALMPELATQYLQTKLT